MINKFIITCYVKFIIISNLNGNIVSIDSFYPFQHSWDTTNEDNGSEHTLSATVSDNAGNMILLQPVLVTVNN